METDRQTGIDTASRQTHKDRQTNLLTHINAHRKQTDMYAVTPTHTHRYRDGQTQTNTQTMLEGGLNFDEVSPSQFQSLRVMKN